MMWVDYTITQTGDNFKVLGDYDSEVMGKQKDGTDKGYALYRPGDVFIVNENGWLCKVEEVAAMVIKYEAHKVKDEV
tara:strand:- start:605 stop:835 length:231 start_codon:yes stop_codon:yes gene_type:complete